MEFRSSLNEFGDDLVSELANLDLSALEKASNWDDPLRLALDQLQSSAAKDKVFVSWLPQLDRHIRLADVVLFYYVRRGALFAPMSVEVLKQWTAACIRLASQTGDESLTESLVYTLGARYKEHPDLNATAQKLAGNSRRVHLAMQRQESRT